MERGNLMLYAQSASAVICGRNRKRGIERKGEGKKRRGRKDKKKKGVWGWGNGESVKMQTYIQHSAPTLLYMYKICYSTQNQI